VKNRDNVGFARAHNQAIHFTDSEYVLVLNPDVILHEKFLERLVRAMDAVPQAGSATGKILKAMGNPKDWLYVIANEVKQSPGDRHVPTAVGTRDDTVDIIDSTGITGDRKRLFRDRGAGEEDRGQYDHEENISRISHIGLISRIGCEGIVGSSGAAAFYRRVALDSVEFEHEFFDELYHSYKEDIDLALRLSRRGWQCVYVPNARAYHFRSLSAPQFQYRLRGYMKRPSQLVFLSYRNHLYTLIKNEPSGLRDLPWIIGWEFGKMMFLLVIKPWVVVKAWRDIIKNWRELMERRKQNQKSKIKNQNEGISSRRVGTP